MQLPFQRPAPPDGVPAASASQAKLALPILLLVLYTGWLIDLGGYPLPNTGPAPVAESWIAVFYLAGWAAVGCGVLAAAFAWMGRPGAAAAALVLGNVGIMAWGQVAVMYPLIFRVTMWGGTLPVVLGYPACMLWALGAKYGPAVRRRLSL